MNILYLHGFGSVFDSQGDKCLSLSKIGKVYGIDIDYTISRKVIIENITAQILENEIDIIMGTSLGGYFANIVGVQLGIPFVMINPVTDPLASLKYYLGDGIDYLGRKYTLDESVISEYLPAFTDPCGLLLLDEGDTVIDVNKTVEYFDGAYETKMFLEGTHRFEHMSESLNIIEEFYNTNVCIFGL